jgi:hypothetical protein
MDKKWAASFTLRLLYPRVKRSWYQWVVVWVGPRTGQDVEEKARCLRGIEPLLLGCSSCWPAISRTTMLSRPPWRYQIHLKILLYLQNVPDERGDTWSVVLLLKRMKISEIKGVKHTNSTATAVWARIKSTEGRRDDMRAKVYRWRRALWATVRCTTIDFEVRRLKRYTG